ncbi:hypothetical protein M422DRAFT_267584 [Sphaerobolus stellatus SS14]|uniref:Uncharacterized protein n=1 Tax=Sphaerobolus stellatus (strain SS14) TaxID=990650 RepID=A0A0C9UZT7_SPHS4|nr:hypothetical protein M422DRAFT_267584 [Sphaerobolus stellatus SS14]
MSITHEIIKRQQYVDSPILERLYLDACPQFEDILTPQSMSKIQHFRATPHTMYHPLVSNNALRLGSCSLVKLEYHGGEQSNFMEIEPESILRFPNMTEMYLTKIRMDVSNWDFLDRIDSPKLRVLRVEKERVWTDEILPFLLRYSQVTGFSEGDSDADDRPFGVTMFHVSVEYCDVSAHTLRALLLNILLHRARHTGNVPWKLELYLALRFTSAIGDRGGCSRCWSHLNSKTYLSRSMSSHNVDECALNMNISNPLDTYYLNEDALRMIAA